MALILCPECEHTVSDKAFSCPACGYPVTIGQLVTIGYYKDWNTVYTTLTDTPRSSSGTNTNTYTFSEVYNLFFHEKFNTPCKSISISSRYAYESAYKNCSVLHKIPFGQLRKQDMQEVLDACPLGYSSACNIKKLFCQLYRFAIENDITEKNYAQYVTNNHIDDTEKGEPFSVNELELLWKHADIPTVQMILIMIYTGFRIKAFETIELNPEEAYLKGGVKTPAGKKRIVPLHEAILPFALNMKQNFPDFQALKFRRAYFYPTLQHLGIATTESGKKHTPHDCRHTFSWLCDKYKVDELSKHLLMGHSPGKDIEKSVYGHRTLDELRTEINKIKC